MNIIGIIVEYNPFHNGHKYHIDKIKEMYPDSTIICVTSSHFCERGEISILNKWDKTKIALENGIDLVIELPFVFSSQSADIFAKGALKILNALKVEKIVFGSEINDIEKLTNIAKLQIGNDEFDNLVKTYLDKGINYPTALSKAISHFTDVKIDTPNDLLGISYIKEIIKNNYNIDAITIKRTNDYHGNNINENIASASFIRKLINEKKDIDKFVPNNVENLVYKNTYFYELLKYKINSSPDLSIYQTVDEGIDKRLYKYINETSNLDELIEKVKSKRYTYNKINRMFIHILTSLTKDEVKDLDVTYIRVLGFNNIGKNYLNKIKKNISIPLITSYKNINDKFLQIEYRATCIYALIVNDNDLIKRELKKPTML